MVENSPLRERRCLTGCELRVQGPAASPRLVGYAAVFDSLSEDLHSFRERIQRGAFKESLRRGDDVRALVEHTGGLSTLGRTANGSLQLREDSHGLRAEILPPDTQTGRDTVELVRRGDLSQMSFGFRAIDDEWHTEDGQTVRELRKVDLFDVSVVSFPAYASTSVSVRSRFETVSTHTLRRLLSHRAREAGYWDIVSRLR